MEMVRPPLRYQISSLRQLPKCLSNNSRNLKIEVADFIQNDLLQGLRVSVVHNTLGTLFSYTFHARGRIVSCGKDELSVYQLLHELSRFGFIVDYDPRPHLSGDQLEYLMTLKGMHMDKLRILSVYSVVNGKKHYSSYIVAFNIEQNPKWIQYDYTPSDEEFMKSLVEGNAVSLNQSAGRLYNWDWLDYVANIDDILRDNA